MDRSLIYVSRKAHQTMDMERTVSEIVSAARLRNGGVGITGALACTQDHFAQLIEGPGVAVEELMHRLECDQRHTNITVLRVEAIQRRRLPLWSLAYAGPSNYVQRQIAAMVDSAAETNAARVERLSTLLVGLANQAAG